VLVGTVLELACFLFEIPTGIVADLYSRRLSVIIGLGLIGAGFILEGAIPVYIVVLLSQVIWGVGATFLSGADDAWIADEIGEENLDKTYLRGTQIGQIFSLIGILVSAIIGSIILNLPMLLGGGLFIALALFLALYMPENGFEPIPLEDKNTWQKMGHTFYEGMKFIKGKPILLVILTISLLYGLYSEGIDRLWNAHFLESFPFPTILQLKPVVWFGAISSCAMILSILAVEIIKRRMDKTGRLEKVWLLMVVNLLLVMSIIVFGMAGNFTLALMAYWASYIVRTVNGPIYRAWMNQNIESKVRATVLSTVGQADAFGQILGGPIIGVIAYKASISKAIIVAGIILSPVILLLLYVLKRTKKGELTTLKITEE